MLASHFKVQRNTISLAKIPITHPCYVTSYVNILLTSFMDTFMQRDHRISLKTKLLMVEPVNVSNMTNMQ